MSHVTHTNESRHPHEKTHTTHTNASLHIRLVYLPLPLNRAVRRRVQLHRLSRFVFFRLSRCCCCTRTDEARHIHQCVTAHVRMSHVTHTKEAHLSRNAARLFRKRHVRTPHIRMSHGTRANKSRHTHANRRVFFERGAKHVSTRTHESWHTCE